MIAWALRGLWCAALAATIGLAWYLVDRVGLAPPIAILGSILFVGALHPATIAAHFVASRVFGDPVPVAFRISTLQALGMFATEVAASLRSVWFGTPFLEGRPAPTPATASRGVAILFIHGYFCNRAIWLSFMRDAAARGYRCEAVTLTNPLGSIDGHDTLVANAMEKLVRGTDDHVVLVGHSMGGLVARAAVRRIDATRIVHFFTLGTPHRGTAAARYGRHASVIQMRRGSAWLAELDTASRTHADWTSIFSHHDDIVYPQSTACLPGAECIAIGGCGHVSLLFDRRVRSIVFDRLAAKFAQPATTGS